MLIPALAARTKYLKTNKKEIEHMCKQMEEISNKSFKEGELSGFAKGESSGIAKRNKDIAIKMHDMGDPVGKIALAVEVSEDQVREWISGE